MQNLASDKRLLNNIRMHRGYLLPARGFPPVYSVVPVLSNSVSAGHWLSGATAEPLGPLRCQIQAMYCYKWMRMPLSFVRGTTKRAYAVMYY